MKSTRHQPTLQRTRLPAAWAALLLTAAVWSGFIPASAGPASYQIDAIAYLDTPAPGGGDFTFDFEPSNINNRGQVSFIADLTVGGEGAFIASKGQLISLARVGDPAPGGGTFAFAVLGNVALNEKGDAAFVATLDPFTLPFGLNSGVYRYDADKGTVSAVVVPSVTPAPGGGTFAGAHWYASLNAGGQVALTGITASEHGVHFPGKAYSGFADGVYVADKRGTIRKAVAAGDPAPGGGTFNGANGPWLNDRGDIAFMGSVDGEVVLTEAVFLPDDTQGSFFSGLGNLYLRRASDGAIVLIVHAGDPAPGGGVFRRTGWPVVDNSGQILFAGDLTSSPDWGQSAGLYLYSQGQIVPLVRPGDSMPGGGALSSVSGFNNQRGLNNSGQAAFNAELDNGEQGVYVWSQGAVHLVVKTGSVLPGIGTIDLVSFLEGFFHESFVGAGVAMNDHGQILFSALLTDGRGVLLVATPRP